jgi:mRNA-degrading endonuclease RelE of RelBE toxin-antitoxin system
VKKRPRGLVQHASFSEQLGREASKHQAQISRKTLDLTRDPSPGGSKTVLKGYSNLYRVRAGDYRIIYTYNDSVVHVLTLRRRDESAYDDLDLFEQEQLEEFRDVPGRKPVKHKLEEWEVLAKQWAAPKPEPEELLPAPITPKMLEQLNVPLEFSESLLKVKTANELLDSQDVPFEIRQQVLEAVCPAKAPSIDKPMAVVELSDLIPPSAAATSGPIDAAISADAVLQESDPQPGASRSQQKSLVRVRPTIPAPLIVSVTRRQEPMRPYRGNTSKGISKETRYTVKLDGSIQLVYGVGRNERALLTADGHPELAELVNDAKRLGGSQGGGAFIINEFRHVLVPTPDGTEVLFAGVYTRDLEFSFEGSLISPVAPAGLRPGDLWPGPHVGVKYTLAAGATDVRYDQLTDRGTLKRVCLTDEYSAAELADLLLMFRRVKPNGGAVYVNEARELFAPVDDGSGYERRYIGHLRTMPWFKPPI